MNINHQQLLNIFGCVPIISIVTGILKAQQTCKSYKICQNIQNLEDLRQLNNLTAKRFKLSEENFSETKKKLLNEYRIEIGFNIIETLPVIGNIISLFRTIYCYHTLAKNSTEPNDSSKQHDAPNQDIVHRPHFAKPVKPVVTIREIFTGKNTEYTRPLQLNENFIDIPVLKQSDGTFKGEIRCGVHAFKNALLALCDDFSADVFNDRAFYKVVEEFVERVSGIKDDEDASIAPLMEALIDLKDPRKHEAFKPYLALLDQEPNAISMFNGVGENFNGLDAVLLGTTGGFLSLYSLANLHDFAKRKGPKKHAFLFGIDGHWVTLVLKVDVNDKWTWFGCDSQPDGVFKRFNIGVTLLKKVLENAKDFAQSHYFEAAGQTIRQLADLLDHRGEILNLQEKGSLLKNAIQNLRILEETFSFMSRLGWLNYNAQLSEEITGYVEDFRKVATFYYRHGIISRNPQWTIIRNTFNISKATWEEANVEAKPLDLTLLQSFTQLRKTRALATVSQAKVHCYNLGPFKDYGWGCAWRTLMTMQSSIQDLEEEPIESIFERYHANPDFIVKLATSLHPHLLSTENPDHRDFEYDITKSLPSHHLNWAEPFTAQLYLIEKGIKSSLEYYKKIPFHTNTPAFAFKKDPIANFEELCSKLLFHFSEQKAAVIIDDGYYSYTILGINVGSEEIDLLITDPHTNTPSDAAYIVTLDNTGKYLRNSLTQIKDQFSDSPKRIDFAYKAWMMLFPQPC